MTAVLPPPSTLPTSPLPPGFEAAVTSISQWAVTVLQTLEALKW